MQFDNLNEMEMALQEKQFKDEEQQHLEEVANNLNIKERFIRFLAHSKYINKPINNHDFSESEQVEERNEANQVRKEFTQELTNWIPTEQENQNNITDEIEDKTKNRNESDDLTL